MTFCKKFNFFYYPFVEKPQICVKYEFFLQLGFFTNHHKNLNFKQSYIKFKVPYSLEFKRGTLSHGQPKALALKTMFFSDLL